MHEVKRGVFFMLDLGNQIGGGDVDEVTGSERKQKSYVEGERRAVRDDAAEQESQRRKEVVEQRPAFFSPAVNENAKVSQFLRHFMGGGGQPRADTDSHVNQKSSGDGEAADEIMHPIGDQD